MAVHYQPRNKKDERKKNGSLLFMVKVGGIKRIWAAPDAASLNKVLNKMFKGNCQFYQL